MPLEWVDGNYPLNSLASNRLFRATAPGKALAAVPLGFVDIGARGGVHGLLAPIAACTAVLGFEPDELACREVNESFRAGTMPWARLKMLPVALADRAGEAILHLCAAPTNHSLLPVNQALAT